MSGETITLVIDEEYGYRTWVCEMTPAEYAEALRRWGTIRGLNCLISVRTIFPTATRIVGVLEEDNFQYVNIHEVARRGYKRCHVHEHDDSWLEGSGHRIEPTADESFWMDGVCRTREEVFSGHEAECGRELAEWRKVNADADNAARTS